MGNVVFGTAVLTPVYLERGDVYQGTLLGWSDSSFVRVNFAFMPDFIQVTSEVIDGQSLEIIYLYGDKDSGFVCSHTFQEIFELADNGPFPVLAYENTVAYLTSMTQDVVEFHTITSALDGSFSFGMVFRFHQDESIEFMPFPISGIQIIWVTDSSSMIANATAQDITTMLELGIMPVLYINGVFAYLIIASVEQPIFLATLPEGSGIVQLCLTVDDLGNVSVLQPPYNSTSADDGVNTRSVQSTSNSLSIPSLSDMFNLDQIQSGNTPVKGVDYWTDEDKQEIIDAVVNALTDKEN